MCMGIAIEKKRGKVKEKKLKEFINMRVSQKPHEGF